MLELNKKYSKGVIFMLKKIFRLFWIMLFCMNMYAQCFAASAVVVFAPECYYMHPQFYEIARKVIERYTQRIIIGPEVDAAFADYAAEHATWRLDLLPEFADEYDCDYWVRIFIANPSFWNATHVNGHTGERTPLAMCAISAGALIMNQEKTVQSGETASLYADYSNFHNLQVVSEEDLICQSFQRDMEAVFEKIGWRLKE
jgi:hypothetical protein